jgi:hypothetical protein
LLAAVAAARGDAARDGIPGGGGSGEPAFGLTLKQGIRHRGTNKDREEYVPAPILRGDRVTSPSPRTRRPALWLATAGLSAVGLSAAVAAVALPGATGGSSVPVVTSDNVSLVNHVPESQAISLEFARTGDFAYVSSLDTITVLDTSEPENPQITGTLVNAMFENEAMTYGERRNETGEVIERFVIAAIDFYQASPNDVEHVNVLGDEIAIVDVTDPANPFIRSYADSSTSTHTVQCVDQADCDFAYTAGTRGKFSILDLRDLDAPKELTTVESPASGPNAVFSRGAGHYWDFDGTVGWHTGSGGAAAFDVTDAENPVLVGTTNDASRQGPLNDFIFHNSMRPNAEAFVEGAEPSLDNGNVLLVTEEDYLNDGDEVECDKAGSFQTWHVQDLGEDVATAGTITPLDSTNAPAEFEAGVTAPAAAFCSAHWFDVHQDGFVAQGWYGAGLRVLDVRDPANIDQFGYATTGATEVWDAYWVPVRDENGVATGEKTDIVYSVDFTRGVDVFEVALPETATVDGADSKRQDGEHRNDDGKRRPNSRR